MDQEEFRLKSYLDILSKRRWTVVSVFLAVFLTTAAATFMMTPMYRATAQVYIDPGAVNQYGLQQPQYPQYPQDTPSYIQTQIGILKSETIAKKVLANLKPDRGGRERPGGRGALQSLLGFFGVAQEGRPAEDRGGQAARSLQDRLEVEAVRNSNLVKVSYEDSDPALAARVVNETVRAFVEQNLEMKVAPAREAMSWLNGRLGEIKSKMSESSSQLQDFKRDQNLLVTGDKQSNISLQALSDLNAKALSAEARRYEAEVKYQQVQKLSGKPDGLMSLPAVLDDKVIQDLKAQQSALGKDIAEQSKKYGEKHPQMVRLRNEVDSLRKQIKNEVSLIVAGLKNEYDESLRAEQSLKKALAQQKAEAMSYERRSTQYEIMNQDVEASKQIYDTVLKRFQESNLMGNASMSSVQLLDAAGPPAAPSSPRKALNILAGILLGLISGVAFAFVAEHLDNTCKSPDEVEEHLKLPFLGVVPANRLLKEKKGAPAPLTLQLGKPAFSESFRNLRGSILLTAGDVMPKVIQVCSAVHSEGKTTVAAGLADAMAAAGEKVLLIDGDMRKPRLHKYLKLQNAQGLSTLLARQAALESVIKTGKNGFKVITAGPSSPNPSELLSSRTMKDAIARLREEFDRIIIDCPPSMGIVDSSFIGPLTDGVVMVVRCGKTPRDLVLKTKKNFEAIKSRIIGVVLNDFPIRSEGYYYYNYNYYYSEKKAAE